MSAPDPRLAAAGSVFETVHASCVVVGEAGILIRGASGAGKSSLCLALIEAATARGLFARLVGDDRIALARIGGALLARPVSPLEGLLEVRGVGLLRRPHLPAARVRLVVDRMEEPPPRLPEEAQTIVEILGVALPRLACRHGRDIVPIALERAAGLSGGPFD